jgi:hypothetical protein
MATVTASTPIAAAGRRVQPLGFARSIGAACFFYILIRPVSENQILVPVLFAIGVLGAAGVLFGRSKLHGRWFPVVGLQFLFGLLGSVGALLNDNPGVVNGVLVYLAAPLLFWTIVAGCDERTVKALFAVLAVGTSVVATTILLYLWGEQGFIPQVIPQVLLDQTGAGVRIDEASTGVRFYGLSTLVAAGPFWVAALLIRGRDLIPGRGWCVYAAGSCAVAALVADRQALVVVMLLSPAVLVVVSRVIGGPAATRRPQRPRGRNELATTAFALVIMFGVVGAVAPTALSITPVSTALTTLTQTFLDPGTDLTDVREGVAIRRYLASRMLDGWSESPVFGRGFGATIQGVVRNPERPSGYELQYHMLLLNTGIVGVLLLGLILLLTIGTLRAAVRRCPRLTGALAAALVGSASMLVANASNPYLQAPGHMWSIYLPILVANVMLVEGNRRGFPARNLLGGRPAARET